MKGKANTVNRLGKLIEKEQALGTSVEKNVFNSLMSDAHCILNHIICRFFIEKEPFGSNFDYEYYKICRDLVGIALERIDNEVSRRMKEQEASEAEPQSEGDRSDKNEVK